MRKSFLKRAVFQVHLWGGLSLGVYAFLIGVTGSALVFHEELMHSMSPPPEIAVTGGAANLEGIRAGIQAHYPDWYPWSLESPKGPGVPWRSDPSKPGGGGKMVYADANGQVVGETKTQGTWLELFEKFSK